MIALEIIPKYNPTNASVTAGTAISSVGSSYDKNNNLNNTNNTGLICVKQFSGGNAPSVVEVQGSCDGVNFSPLVTLTQGAQTGLGGGGAANTVHNFSSGVIPPYLRMKVTTAAHTTNSDTTSGVSLIVVY